MYLHFLRKVTTEVDPPARPGDIAVWRFGRAFSHGAIVTEWPWIVHACLVDSVRIEDVSKALWLTTIGERGPECNKPRPMKLLSRWSR